MTIDEELTVSFVSRFTSISLHAPEPLHYLRSGSHGFWTGAGLEPIINDEDTRQALSLVLGGLSSYTCESEENSRLSGSDDPLNLLWAQVWPAKQGGTGRLELCSKNGGRKRPARIEGLY